MKITKFEQRKVLLWAACGMVGLTTIGLIVRPLLAQPAPGLTISLISSNEFQIRITNGVGYANYEIHWQLELDPYDQWIPYSMGLQGQTNFTTDMGIFTRGFFIAAIGSDWDGDGITNSYDAQPTSTNAGLLSITIDSPTNTHNILQ